MSTYRQKKIFEGATAGGFFSDSLGNPYSLNISVAPAWGAIEVYNSPDGSGPVTAGGELSYRGVTFDDPVTDGALIVIICYFRYPGGIKTMTRQVMVEFGLSVANPNTVTDYDFYTGSGTSHRHANAVTPSTTAGTPQVWIAANMSDANTSGSRPLQFETLGLSDPRDRAFYRAASTTLNDHTAPFTTTDSVGIAALLTHFVGVDPTSTDGTVPDAKKCCESTGTPGDPTDPVNTTRKSDPYLPPGDITIACVGDGIVPEGGQGVDGSDDWKA